MQPPDCDGQIRNNDGEHEQSGQQPTAVVKPGRSAPASLFRPPLRRSEAEGGIDEAQDEHPNDHEQEEHPELFRPGSAGELRIALERQRSEEHTSELQSLMRTSYAVICLKKKNKKTKQI